MKIKSLLLASAAAMVSVSGAQAADAVVVEPEPAEYVRICDAYGAGFFYIPGTETCMKFSGYVRTNYAHVSTELNSTLVDSSGATPVTTTTNTEEKTNTWSTRARFDIDTRNETDLGTLRALIRFQANAATDDGSVGDGSEDVDPSSPEIDKALITLAGIRAGIGDSLFNANFAVVNLAGVASVETLSGTSVGEDLRYGFSNAHVLDYTFNLGDFYISAGLEVSDGTDAQNNISYLAKVQYKADNWTLGVVGEREDDKDVAYKIYDDVDISEFVPGGKIGGWYMTQDREIEAAGLGSARLGASASNTYNGADSIWGIGFQADVTDNIEFVALHTQWNDESGNATSGGLSGAYTDGSTEATTIGLNWYPVDGLKMFGSYSFGSSERSFNASSTQAINQDSDAEAFVIGLRRSF